MNSPTATIPTSASTNVFDNGNHITTLIKVEQNICNRNSNSHTYNLPRPLLICSPSDTGLYPVLLLLHGYLLSNSFYSQLMQHIASHGFIVVAPQLYSIAGPDASQEIKITAEVTNWLSQSLSHFLPPQVQPNLTKLALSGHSRGGKVAFALALAKPSPIAPLKFSALIGIDPVDGMDKGKQTPPPVLTYTPHSFNLDGVGVLVIGSGLGEIRRNPFFPPCAPKGVNHEDFYRECCKPVHYFVARGYGHLDMLDDETKGIRGKSSYCLCKNGEARGPMRRFVGGAMVAFLRGYLEGDMNDLVDVRERHGTMPLELQRVEFQV